MQARAPACHPRRAVAAVGLAPEPGQQRAQQQLLHQAHVRVRRHFEGTQLQQPQAAGGPIGRVHLVDAELAAVGVAGDVDQQVAQAAVDQPRRHLLLLGKLPFQLGEGDLDLVDLVVARLVDARRLAGRADEHAREQVAQGRVVVPIGQQADQHVGAAQERAVRGRRTAEHEVVAAARAGMAAVEHELLGGQARAVRRVVQELGVVDQFLPARCRVDVDLDHARVGRHLQDLQPRVTRRRVAFEHHLDAEFGGRGLDGGQQFQVILQVLQRRQEDIEHAALAAMLLLGLRAVGALRVAHLDAQRGARQPAGGFVVGGLGVGVSRRCGLRQVRPARGAALALAATLTRPRLRLQRDVTAFGKTAAHPVRIVAGVAGPAGELRAQRGGVGQGAQAFERVLRDQLLLVGAGGPGQRIERQAVTHRRVARHQVQPLVAQEP